MQEKSNLNLNQYYSSEIRQTSNTLKKNYKTAFLFAIIIFVFAIYTLRLFTLQIANGEKFKVESKEISTSETIILPQRGMIYDRNAKNPMVNNIDSFAVDITPGDMDYSEYDTILSKLASYLGIKKSTIEDKIFKALKISANTKEARKRSLIRNHNKPIEIMTDVSLDKIMNIAENLTDLSGISWRRRPIRNNLATQSMSHILGYVGNIDDEELKVLYNHGYTDQSIVGKNGIEKEYDQYLQGIPGSISKKVDAHGKKLSDELEIIEPKSGNNLILTIDSKTQELAEKALGERIGATIVLRPSNGEILAMVSYPYYGNNTSTNPSVNEKLQTISSKINRAVQGLYPPASTFKTIMTTAALSEKAIPATKKIECEGKMNYGNRIWRCHQAWGHGYLDLKNALAQSCDVYYWVLGTEYLGVNKIASYAKEFGFGESLEIDLPNHSAGTLPTPQWKWSAKKEKWLGGDTANMSIGQGDLLVTPLHVANMMAMVCNSGVIYKPHLLKEIRDSKNEKIIKEIQKEVLHKSTVAPEVWREVQNDLRYVITDGTPFAVMANKTVQIAGKTGTGEVEKYKSRNIKQWHSWMIAYAPFNAPVEEQIVVVTFIDADNDWEWCAPYCTNIIIQGYFNDQTCEEAIEALHYNKKNKVSGRME